MRLAALIVLGASAAVAGPNAGVFGIVARDSRKLEESGGYGAEARFGWPIVDALTFETAAGFTRSEPQSWLFHLSVGPKVAPLGDAGVSPYVRVNAGIGARTPARTLVCPDGVPGSECNPNPGFDANWAFPLGAAAGTDIRIVRGWRISAELGWRRFYFEGDEARRDVRGLWLGLSFR